MAAKKTLLIDFDGTISQYTGWKGLTEVGPPIEKARHALCILARDFKIVYFTTRIASVVEPWLKRHGFPEGEVTNNKPPAFLIIDDRAITFKGEWTDELLQQIRNFKPWWETADAAQDRIKVPEGDEPRWPGDPLAN